MDPLDSMLMCPSSHHQRVTRLGFAPYGCDPKVIRTVTTLPNCYTASGLVNYAVMQHFWRESPTHQRPDLTTPG